MAEEKQQPSDVASVPQYGVPVSFHFVSLIAGQQVSFTLSSGGNFTGALYSAPEGTQVTQNTLSFTTPSDSAQGAYISLEFQADIGFYETHVSGSLFLDPPAVLQLTIPETSISQMLQDGPFDFDLHVSFPPTCILDYHKYALQDEPCPPAGNFPRQIYIYEERFYCCSEPPY